MKTVSLRAGHCECLPGERVVDTVSKARGSGHCECSK